MKIRTGRRYLLGCGLLLAACPSPCSSARGTGAPAEAPRDERAAEHAPVEPSPVARSDSLEHLPEVQPLDADVLRGVCYAHAYQDGGSRGYGSETSRQTLRTLRAHHVQSVSLTPFGFLRSLRAHEIQHADSVGASETDARTRQAIVSAHGAGHSVMLKPHLWIARGDWRARLDPAAGWDAFFDSYEGWIVRYARLAAETDVEWLVIGTELRSSLGQERRWRQLIGAVREVYDGQIIYAANWDAMDSVPFWDSVDALGVQFYPPLARELGTSVDAIGERLGDHLDRLGDISARHERPLIFTEVGYRSVHSAALRPHEWTEHSTHAEVDQALQRQLYALFFASVRDRPFVRGVYLWKWFTDPASREEGPTGFSPAGKPAAEVMRAAYASPGLSDE